MDGLQISCFRSEKYVHLDLVYKIEVIEILVGKLSLPKQEIYIKEYVSLRPLIERRTGFEPAFTIKGVSDS